MNLIKDELSKCLVCGEDAKGSRGLCVAHYLQYTRKRKLLDKDAAAAWENQLIEAGKLLPNQQGKRTDAIEDAFAEDFERFLSENPTVQLKPKSEEIPSVVSVHTKLAPKAASANKRGKSIESKATKKKG